MSRETESAVDPFASFVSRYYDDLERPWRNGTDSPLAADLRRRPLVQP